MMARVHGAACVLAIVSTTAMLSAHDGPPFPIVSSRPAGAYVVSVWTDPDTTDDGSAGGQFWVRLHRADNGQRVPDGTHATVAIHPLIRTAVQRTGRAEPVRGDITNQFVALVMDHEGRFGVRVSIEGPLGPAAVDAEVEATYALRPARPLLALYVIPFLIVGFLWGRLLLRRRGLLGGRRRSG